MNDFLPITLSLPRAVSLDAGLKAYDPPEDLKKKIYERDDYTCRYCGFQSRKYMAVQAMNNVPSDHREENLATSCIFCHQCFNLHLVPLMRSGVLIWLPEIPQARLHHIARAIYIARISQGPAADTARKGLESLLARRAEAKARLGSDDPYILASVLRDYLTDKAYGARARKLGGVRLFPLDQRVIQEADLKFNQFPQILAYWRSKDGPFGGKLPQNWIDYHKIVAQAS